MATKSCIIECQPKEQMKIFQSAIVLGLAALMMGCTTTGQFDLNKSASGLRLATNLGTYYLVRNEPQTRPIIQNVHVGLDVLINGQNADTNAFIQTIQTATASNPDVQVAMNAVAELYLRDYADGVASGISRNVVAVTLMKGVDNGLKDTLTQSLETLHLQPVK